MHRFQLKRSEDVSGVSGTGIVAEGVEFSNGTVALCWLGNHSSVVLHDNIKSLVAIHGHEGRTVVVWIDKIEGEI